MTSSSNILLGNNDLLISASLLLISACISIFLSLNLEKKLFIAGIRTFVQLSSIGFVLKFVFTQDNPYLIAAILLFMTVIAAQTINSKSKAYRGVFFDSLLAMILSTWTISSIGLIAVLGITPWYAPQYSIPMVGLMLGNTLTAVALSLERYTTSLKNNRDMIDTELSMGATAWEASRRCARQAISAGMLPTMNSMAVVGLVSLPGMMTGQILAGSPPEQAVKYQIVTMFLIAAGSSLSCLFIILLAFRRFFDREHRFKILIK